MRHTEMSGGTGVVSCDLVQNCPFFSLSLSQSPRLSRAVPKEYYKGKTSAGRTVITKLFQEGMQFTKSAK